MLYEPYEVLEPHQCPAHSCYLMEFSVMPGGARMADVDVVTSVDDLDEHGFDEYLLMWYGAVLQLWVVQEGVIVEGIDLLPYVRSDDERCDRALTRLIEYREQKHERWKAIDTVLEPYFVEMASALPLVAHVLDLQDRIEADDTDTEAAAGLARILDDAKTVRPAEPYGGVHKDLRLDLGALAQVVPPLREPILTADWVRVHWADPDLRHPESHLHYYEDPADDVILLNGLNDLEGGVWTDEDGNVVDPDAVKQAERDAILENHRAEHAAE